MAGASNHRHLVNTGLLDYLRSRSEDGDGWLFPVLRATKRRKRPVARIPADEFSKWFGRYRAAARYGRAMRPRPQRAVAMTGLFVVSVRTA